MVGPRLDPACGVQVKLKQVWQDFRAAAQGGGFAKVLASKGGDPACNQRLLPIWAHEGPCRAVRT